jgi:hypothetical protein
MRSYLRPILLKVSKKYCIKFINAYYDFWRSDVSNNNLYYDVWKSDVILRDDDFVNGRFLMIEVAWSASFC